MGRKLFFYLPIWNINLVDSGFSIANLWRMRSFYLGYTHNLILAPLVREIGWTHNLVILEKYKDDLEREF